MARKKKVEEHKGPSGESGSGRWMLTYLDMVTLLFGFFVILYAMSQIDAKKFDEAAESIRSGFNGGNTISVGRSTGGKTIITGLKPEGIRHPRLRVSAVSEDMLRHLKNKYVRVDEIENGYHVSLASDNYFRPGSAELDFEEGRRTLKQLSLLLNSLPTNHKVEVIGHTDNQPVDRDTAVGRRFLSNWELSTARSTTIARFLIDAGANPRRFYIAGRGEYDPIENNDTPEGRAYNRRVDVYITTGR